MQTALRVLLFLIWLPLGLRAEPAGPRVLTGEINGARWTALVPANWDGRVWIEAHGLREAATPLIADLHPAALFPRQLLERRWVVATTSYRRNGLIVADAIDDLVALRAKLAELLREPKLTVVEGSSMGGAIVTLMAERGVKGFDGFVAAGAALEVKDPAAPELTLTRRPRVPLLFLTNQSEFDGPQAYVKQARSLTGAAGPLPVIWKVRRDGHVNVNTAERLAALEAVAHWATTTYGPTDRDDATVAPDPGPSTAVRNPDGSLSVRVVELSRVYGNLTTDLQPRDLASIGVLPGAKFWLHSDKGKFEVLFGKTYRDVPRGGWVAFVTGEGQIMFARNFANAAERAEVELGSALRVECQR